MRFIIIILLFLMSFAISSCGTDSPRSDSDDSLEARARRYPEMFPIIVYTLPDGFILLNDAMRDTEGLLRFRFWKTTFSLTDSEEFAFFRTDVHDDNFIVIYMNQYYICENQFSQIVDDAIHTYEQLNRIYSIGDVMEIRGQPLRTVYKIIITSVERREMSAVAVYEINFSISPSVNSRYIIDFFEAAVLRSGNRVYDFVLVNEGKVTIELNSTEYLDMLILNIPRGLRVFVNQNSTRVVSVQ